MNQTAYRALGVLLSAILLAAASSGAERPQDSAPLQWYKGNLHTHSLWSDGDEFPEVVVEWYRGHGYQFLALTDHDVFAPDGRWMTISDLKNKRRFSEAAVTQYLSRDKATIQTRGQFGQGDFAVRLKPYSELAAALSQPGQFLLLPGEEVTAIKPSVHINAIGLPRQIEGGGADKRAAIAHTIQATNELAGQSGRPILTVINHPNFDWALNTDDLIAATDGRFMEVFNAHPKVHHDGDQQHPGVERMWDLANAARIGQYHLPPLLGTAGDDAHTFAAGGEGRSEPGRGWIMVRCRELTESALIRAIQSGDIYASSGVTLHSVLFNEATRTLELEIEPDGEATFTTQFIASISGDRRQIGVVVAEVPGRQAKYQMTGKELYVRALITSSQPCQNPSIEGQHKQAWTQPVGWQRYVERDTARP